MATERGTCRRHRHCVAVPDSPARWRFDHRSKGGSSDPDGLLLYACLTTGCCLAPVALSYSYPCARPLIACAVLLERTWYYRRLNLAIPVFLYCFFLCVCAHRVTCCFYAKRKSSESTESKLLVNRFVCTCIVDIQLRIQGMMVFISFNCNFNEADEKKRSFIVVRRGEYRW